MQTANEVPIGGIRQVVDGGYCVGCGACAVASGGRIVMRADDRGVPVPRLDAVTSLELDGLSANCPFSGTAPDEDEIAARVFPAAGMSDRRIGRYEALLAGRINDDPEILRSSSGGLTTWILLQLLQQELIDGVIHLGRASASDQLFEFGVSHTVEEVLSRRKSQYYAADFSGALSSIRGNGKRYAIVGVPCFAKAVRQLTLTDDQLSKQVAYVIALVCGHMKSPAFAQLLAWQLGVKPSDVATVDFRVKEGSTRADDYNFSVTSKNGATRVGRTRELFGTNWGHAMFQLKACDFCDDVFGETADACLGDAWLDRFAHDPRGTNIAVVRNNDILRLLKSGAESGVVTLERLSVEESVHSQAGNFRHRREGLAVRLRDAELVGDWHPPKRNFVAYTDVSFYRRVIVRLRRELGNLSHQAFRDAKASGQLAPFLKQTGRIVRRIELVYKLPLLTAPTQLISRGLRKAFKTVGLQK